MKVSVFVPSIGRRAGGPLVLYQYANHLARLGHEVHVGHAFFTPEPKHPLIENAAWFEFDEGLHHHCVSFGAYAEVAEGFDFGEWDSDVMIGRTDLFDGYGLPVGLVQGPTFGLDDLAVKNLEGPILCVSKGLVEECVELGVAPQRLVHAPNGIDHDVFRPHLALKDRPLRVSTLYNWVELKRSRLAVEVLDRVREEIPDLQVTMFGMGDAPPWIPDWIDYLSDVDHQTLAREVYGTSRVYLCAADYEGFGLTSLEAMACGAALVTTDTGGSRDFADHEVSALVSEPGDADALLANLLRVLRDDELRLQLAESGMERAAEFDWPGTARILETTFEDYLENPDRYLEGT